MNLQAKARNAVKTEERSDITYAVCQVGIWTTFSFAVIVGVISLASLVSGIITAGGPIKFIASMFAVL